MVRVLNEIGWWLMAIWFAGYATLRVHSGQSLDSPITVGEISAFVVVFGLMVGRVLGVVSRVL